MHFDLKYTLIYLDLYYTASDESVLKASYSSIFHDTPHIKVKHSSPWDPLHLFPI
ncbi:hypothetical protein Syun_000863 [Stephania yunnanensis]|uniref:Uncharacterized protein n=1 Tax=Stephania yunnanensis TaxID=152371 RepID=A0AAP0LDV6_9MAGN